MFGYKMWELPNYYHFYFGMTVVDCWKSYRYHLSHKSRHKSIPVKHFVSMLAKDMLTNTFSNIRVENVDLFLGRREDGQSSKHSGTVISCADTTMICSTLS